MIIKHFSIYDSKSQLFGQVFPSQTLGSAERSFKEAHSNQETQISRYPEDFSLYYVFDYDDSTGAVTETYEPPQLVAHAKDFIKS